MDFEVAKEKAIRYIGISRKTEYEVFQKLKKLKFDDEIINKVIEYIKNLNYLNDHEYVDAYIRQCMRLQNYSIYEIKNKLLQKGIKKDIIDEKIEVLYESDYEKNVVEKLLKGKLKNTDDGKRKAYLYRRGFKTFKEDF